MSTLSVTRITTGDADTPLIFTTGNTTSGAIKVEAANAEVVLFGVARVTGGLISNGVDILTNFGYAFDQSNLAFNKANVAYQTTGGTINGDVAITGNLSVFGNTTTHATDNLIINDPIVLLANTNNSDLIDIGLVAHYVNSGAQQVHTGFFRDHQSKEWFLFKEYNVHFLDYDGHIDPSGNNFTIDMLNASLRTSNLILGGINALPWMTSSFNTANLAFTTANSAFSAANTKASTGKAIAMAIVFG